MEIKLNALCVKTVDYKDNDRLLTLCTLERSKILVKATGCKLPKAKLKYAASPLCFGEYSLIERNGRYTLKGCDMYDNFNGLTADLSKYYGGFAVLECLDKLSKENDAETARELTLTAVNALKDFAYTDVSVYKRLCAFYINVLQTAGYGLNFDYCSVDGKPLENDKICYDYSQLGIVSYKNRSMDYEVVSDEMKEYLLSGEGEESAARNCLAFLDRVLSSAAFVNKNYALSQLLSV